MTFGTFIDPDTDLEDMADPNQKLGLPIYGGFRAAPQFKQFRGFNRIFDRIVDKVTEFRAPYEDQCSPRYYFDLVNTLRDYNGEFDRLVEVGVYMGGSSSIFGGCVEEFDFDLDLVDFNAGFLRFSYERIRRTHPEAAKRVRLFHGDLPSYVNTVLQREDAYCIVHHDAAHDFNQVVKDMASLSYVQEKLHAIIAQDTHLRGSIEHMNFVDMALYAVFGLDLNYAQIGVRYDETTNPDQYYGNYFAGGQSEGMVLPMAMNRFHYPHPSAQLEALLPKAA